MSPAFVHDGFPQRVAEHLGISTATEIENGGEVLEAFERAQVRQFIDDSDAARLVTETHREALGLAGALVAAWQPALVK